MMYLNEHSQFNVRVLLGENLVIFMPTAILAVAYCFCRVLKNLACFEMCSVVLTYLDQLDQGCHLSRVEIVLDISKKYYNHCTDF